MLLISYTIQLYSFMKQNGFSHGLVQLLESFDPHQLQLIIRAHAQHNLIKNISIQQQNFVLMRVYEHITTFVVIISQLVSQPHIYHTIIVICQQTQLCLYLQLLHMHGFGCNVGQFWIIQGHCMSLSLMSYWVIRVSKSDPIAMLVEIITDIICVQLIYELPKNALRFNCRACNFKHLPGGVCPKTP